MDEWMDGDAMDGWRPLKRPLRRVELKRVERE
jgi:hypothetical protein